MVVYEEEKAKLLAYTREVSLKDYPEGLAYSVHLACSRDGEQYYALHGNYGILFAEAEISREDTIVPKGVKNPRILKFPQGGFGILADRVRENGEAEEREAALLWKTRDFREFETAVVLEKSGTQWEALQEAAAGEGPGEYIVEGRKVTGSCLETGAAFCDRIVQRWTQIHNTEIRLPESVRVSGEEQLKAVRAQAVYSDGSVDCKKVCWDTEGIDWEVPGIRQVKGRVCQREFPFPLLKGYGDPVIFPWEGKWYFLGTNDNQNDIGIYVREADTVEALFGSGEHLILGVDEEKGFVQTFWAPEFHVIGRELYILFAVSGKAWGPQCHLMRLKKGGHITESADWEEPVKVLRKDGSPLGPDGITLDMTYLKAGGASYMVWSYRRGIGTPGDTGSMLYIAGVEEHAPWKLSGEPVLLSRPLFGWENVSGTINNEGPHGFTRDGRVYLAYSGGAANGYTYVLGLLTAEENQDLTDVRVWKKSGFPVLSFYSVKGEYGPGHHSFYADEDGKLMMAYHGETALESHLRCDGIRRVHFNLQGEPVFDLSAQRDLAPGLKEVSLQVKVTAENGCPQEAGSKN